MLVCVLVRCLSNVDLSCEWLNLRLQRVCFDATDELSYESKQCD